MNIRLIFSSLVVCALMFSACNKDAQDESGLKGGSIPDQKGGACYEFEEASKKDFDDFKGVSFKDFSGNSVNKFADGAILITRAGSVAKVTLAPELKEQPIGWFHIMWKKGDDYGSYVYEFPCDDFGDGLTFDASNNGFSHLLFDWEGRVVSCDADFDALRDVFYAAELEAGVCYTEASKKALQEAKEAAQKIWAKEGKECPEDAEITTAKENIKTAFDGLVAIDKSGLEDALGKYGKKEGCYSEASWGAYQTALKVAEDIDCPATQEEVNAAAAALKNAAKALKDKDFSALYAALDLEPKFGEDCYTDSWKTFNDAKFYAENLGECPSEDAIKEAADAIVAAFEALELKRTVTVKFAPAAQGNTNYITISWESCDGKLAFENEVYEDYSGGNLERKPFPLPNGMTIYVQMTGSRGEKSLYEKGTPNSNSKDYWEIVD